MIEIYWLILVETGKFNVKVRKIGELGSKVMPRMMCFHTAGGGRTEGARVSYDFITSEGLPASFLSY